MKTYRKGAVGAMMDEYERASSDLKLVLRDISEDDFTSILDKQTEDESCRSVQTIMTHVVRAGYGYADYIREQFGISKASPSSTLIPHRDVEAQFDAMLDYTAQTLGGRWEMPENEWVGIGIDTHWGVRYDLEQLLEHAIVHILRHRRQIERLRSTVVA
jgi:uncharacterized damage-inducible protein DinB